MYIAIIVYQFMSSPENSMVHSKMHNLTFSNLKVGKKEINKAELNGPTGCQNIWICAQIELLKKMLQSYYLMLQPK